MRVVVLGVALMLGCGRVGFDPRTGDASGDGVGGEGAGATAITLSIDHTRVAGDLVDFPVLVELHDPALGTATQGGNDGVRFFDANGTLLAHEIESLTAAGDLIAWVKVPLLSMQVDTMLLLRFGGALPAALAPAEVWSNGFTNVHHWGDGLMVDVRDSTGVNDGQSMGDAAPTMGGKIFGGLDLSGGAPIRANAAGMNTSPGGRNTLSYWVDMRAPTQKSPATFAFGDCGGACDYDVWFFTDSCVGFNTAQGEVIGTTRGAVFGAWVHVAAIFVNGVPSTTNVELYLDGELQQLSLCMAGTPAARTAGGPIYWGGYRSYEMTGVLDEGRVAGIARSAQWIKTEYENQRDPTAFVRVQ